MGGGYALVDIFKFLFCLCIIALHTQAFNFLPKDIRYFIEKTIFRVAVPYFFIASGFFVGRKIKAGENNWIVIKKYCLRLVKPFVVFSIINTVQHFITGGEDYLFLLKDIVQHLLFSPYGALWYIQASLIGILLLYPFIKYNKMRIALIIGAFLYGFALLCNNYYFLIKDIWLGQAIEKYLAVCITGRNGLFVGFFWLGLGITCANIYNEKILSKYKVALCFVICYLLYITECILIWKIGINDVKDDGALYIVHIAMVPALFLTTVMFSENKTICQAKVFRNLSTGMYFLHRPIQWCVSVSIGLLSRLSNNSVVAGMVAFLTQGFAVFIITAGVSAVICLMVYRLKKEPFYSLLK